MSVRPGRRSAPGAAAPLAAVGLLLVAAFAAASSHARVGQADRASGPVGTFRGDRGEPLPRVEPPGAEVGDLARISWWPVVAVLAVVLAVAVLALVVAMLRRSAGGTLRRRIRPLPRPGSTGDDQDLAAALDAGLDQLEDGGDPRSAVIRCWTTLEASVASAGVARRASDTATDLVLRLLRARQVSEPALQAFAELYRQARYAPHEVDDRMRTRARGALRQLRQELDPIGAGVGR